MLVEKSFLEKDRHYQKWIDHFFKGRPFFSGKRSASRDIFLQTLLQQIHGQLNGRHVASNIGRDVDFVGDCWCHDTGLESMLFGRIREIECL